MTDLEEQRGLQAALSELLAGGGWGKVRGVLLCGSRAKGTHHERSDYDLLVVTTKRIGKLVRENAAPRLDATLGTAEYFEEKLQRRASWNNNFVLNAFYEGKVLAERDSVMTLLKTKAQRIYAEGPPVMNAAEAMKACDALRRMYASANGASLRRPAGEVLPGYVARFRADQAASRATYLYFMAHREWCESLPDMLMKSRVQFPELAELWDAYVQEVSARGRAERLAAMVESACAALMRGVADPTAAF